MRGEACERERDRETDTRGMILLGWVVASSARYKRQESVLVWVVVYFVDPESRTDRMAVPFPRLFL